MTTSRVTPIHRPSRLRLAWYLFWVRYRFSESFRALRLANRERIAQGIEGPLIVFLNHPSDWDPMPGQLLQMMLLPQYVLYAAIEVRALAKAKKMHHRGVLPVEIGSPSGARQFFRDCDYLLSFPDTMLSINPEGQFTDPRIRPLQLKRGLSAVVARTGRVTLLPVAIEYTFWDKDKPEILTSLGEPIYVEDGRARSADEWHTVLTEALTATMDELAELNMRRQSQRFELLVFGRFGPRNLKKLIGEIRELYRRRRR